MGILIRKQKGVIVLTVLSRLSLVTFLMSLSFSLVDTIWAVYLDSFVNSVVYVGFLSAFLTLVSFFSFFLFIPLIEKTSKSRIFSYTLIMFMLSYILFAISTKFYFIVLLSFIVTVLQTLRVTTFGIIVRDKSSEKQLSRNEGLTYTFMDLAWVVGPLIAGLLSEKYGINLVFVLAAIFIFITFLFFEVSKVKDVNIKKRVDKSLLKNFTEFFKNRDRVLAYILGGGVNFWWSLIYLFIPLLIIREGLGIEFVGYFLFSAAIPLILFEFYFSKLAGKVGFKKIFQIGFFIPAFFAFICFFISDIYVIMLLLVLSSVGIAMIQSTSEAYFFDMLKGKQELKFYGPYNTTIDINHFVGRGLSAVLLLFLPFRFVFLFFSISMLVFSIISFKVKNVIESRRDGRKN